MGLWSYSMLLINENKNTTVIGTCKEVSGAHEYNFKFYLDIFSIFNANYLRK